MHYIIYFLTVPVVLLCGLLGLSATMQPAVKTTAVQPVPAARLVPTTTAEMAARAREEALAIEAEFKRRNPQQPVAVASSVAAPTNVKAVRKTAAAGHSERKKTSRVARHDMRLRDARSRDARADARAVEGSFGLAAAPSLSGLRSIND